MKTALLPVLAALILLGCCCPRLDPVPAPIPGGIAADAPVRAQRYRTWVYSDALEMTHGGGHWVEELFFPAEGVVANVQWDLDMTVDPWVWRPTMNVFRATKARNSFRKGFHDEADTVTPVEEVLVPAALVRSVLDAVSLRERYESAQRSLGDALSKANLVRQQPSGQ